ncbi:MAG TPA: glycoside hydrolase family 30 beta sandwich domain-containing protein [Polyangiaceae bacterium]|nr:glycoside hydrolase family 30 beta sandwich domain-containing protein [Polyangiaceae bacterium]
MTKFSILTYGLTLLLPACGNGNRSYGAPAGDGGHTNGGSGGMAVAGSPAVGGAGGGSQTGSAGAGNGGSPVVGTGGSVTAGMGGSPSATGGASSGGVSAGGGSAGTGTSSGGVSNTGPVTLLLTQTHQTIEGFGINDTYNAPIPSSLFDASKDIGLTILRIGMNPTGGLVTSAASQDITMVKGISGTKIIGSTWTAPANCKSNNNVNDGGHLNTDCYTSWATAITKFATDNGLYAMSVANEPEFASCGTQDPCNGNYPTMLYTANEMVAFIKVVGPMLQKAGVKVISGETSEWDHLWSNKSAGPDPGGHNSSDPLKCGFPPSNPVCDMGGGYDYGHYLAKDATAWAAFDIIGTHEYDSQHAYPWPSDVTAARKEVWQTEMSGVKWWPEQGPSTDINNGIAVAGWIHEALVIGDASAWLYWNYKQTGDNEGLVTGSDTKRHWTFGNYSRFVRPGYKRVEVGGAIPNNVFLSAYLGSDGTVVVVAINKTTATASVPITISGGTAPASMTPWVTSSSDDLASKTAVAVTNGTFTASLGASTVTTFVGK